MRKEVIEKYFGIYISLKKIGSYWNKYKTLSKALPDWKPDSGFSINKIITRIIGF